ncbi:ATP12 family chaperone protein [Aestuariibius sp. 2305UL40-4]|uniref:ATP12 family chaperone protein n=1 Tax=Aestuariibius violaceus TaxID=3234132 RepID=UPI00345E18DC
MSEWKQKRFWKEAVVEQRGQGFAVLLDGRQIKTPAGVLLELPSQPLAEHVAREWDSQTDVILPQSMPMTRAANSAIDKVAPNRNDVVTMLAAYAETDLVCYRADGPHTLIERQAEAWDEILRWAEADLDARLVPTQGIIPVPQPPSSLRNLHDRVDSFTPFELVAVADLVTLSGSLVLGLAATTRRWDAGDLWQRSRVDELWQIEQWGEDAEATAAAEIKRSAFLDAVDFFGLVQV